MGVVSFCRGGDGPFPGRPGPPGRDFPEDRIDRDSEVAGNDEISLGRAAPPDPAELDLQREELAGQREPVVGLGLFEEASIRRPPAGPPGGLEWLAVPWMAGPGRAIRRPPSAALVGHQFPSTYDSQVLRIRSSRRATVRRAQPSWSAISSLV